MWFFIGPILIFLLIAGAVWLRNRWVLDTFNSYGVYGSMAGLYIYKKFGLWHIGNKTAEGSLSEEAEREFGEPRLKKVFTVREDSSLA